MSFKTPTYKLDYFKKGGLYLSSADYRRFVTLDYNLDSYVGLVGVGIISGWEVEHTDGLEVKILPGTGLIDGYSSESPYIVKQRSSMVNGEREGDRVRYNSDPQQYLTDIQRSIYVSVIQEYDPTFNPIGPIEDCFVKVIVPSKLTLNDNTDNYIYAFRPIGAKPYPKLNDYPWMVIEKPSPRIYSNYLEYKAALAIYNSKLDIVRNYDWQQNSANHFTTVDFESTLNYTVDSSVVLIAKVTTRNGMVTTIDASMVDSLSNLNSTISSMSKEVLSNHIHGGSGTYDPPNIKLETDIRQCVFNSFNGNDKTKYNVLDSNQTTIAANHKHSYMLDGDSNGLTISIIGSSQPHFHKIVNGILQIPEFNTYNVEEHIHELQSEVSLDWTDESSYVVYVNGEVFGDETSSNIVADVSNKTITLSGAVGSLYRLYSSTFTVPAIDNVLQLQNKTFTYSKTTSSLLSFMLSMSAEFEKQYGQYYYDEITDTISNKHPFVFTTTDADGNISFVGFNPLIQESSVGQVLMTKVGDQFTFTPYAARNITVELVEFASTSSVNWDVTIEILGNTEVSGQLKAENIAYVHASKITLGSFETSTIPFISHIGRFREEFLPSSYPLISNDGVQYSVSAGLSDSNLSHYHEININQALNGVTQNTLIGNDIVYYANGQTGTTYLIDHNHSIINGVVQTTETDGLTEWQKDVSNSASSTHTHNIEFAVNGDSNVVYSISEDSSGNIYAGTSCAFYVIPTITPYLFVINGIRIYLTGSVLWDMLLQAKIQYEKDTGLTLNISEDVYLNQLALAEEELVDIGDSYLLYGENDPQKGQDLIMIKLLSSIPVPDFKYTAFKQDGEINRNEVVLGTKIFDSITGEIIDPSTYANEKEFNDALTAGTIVVYKLVERNLNKVPIWSSVVKNVDGKSMIISTGANIIAIAENITNNFYKDWSIPSLPVSILSMKKVIIDSNNDLWFSTNNGIMVSRYKTEWSQGELTKIPGYTPNIKDIVLGENNVIYCVSRDGVFKSENGGKAWTRKHYVANGFSQIIRDIAVDKTNNLTGHYHTISVNSDGNGTTSFSIGSGASHIHSITGWTIESTLAHTHTLVVSLYSIANDKTIYKSLDNGETWTKLGTLPTGEYSEVFVYNGKIFIGMTDGLYSSFDDAKTWNNILEEKCYSFSQTYSRVGFFVGTENKIYRTTDGITFSLVYDFGGIPLTSLYKNNDRQYFGYAYNGPSNSFYFKDVLYTSDYITAFVDFSRWYANKGGWETGTPYDIFIDYKLVLSTKSNVDTRTDTQQFNLDTLNGIIDLSASSNISQQIDIYDSNINVENNTGFQVGDEVYIVSEKTAGNPPEFELTNTYYEKVAEYSDKLEEINNMYFYANVSAIINNTFVLTERSDKKIELPAKIYKLPHLQATTHIHANVYDSPLSNVGINTHEDLEDKLSYVSDYRPYSLNNIYLSNLLQLVQGLRYVYPTIDDKFSKTKIYDFNYSIVPEDPYYFGKFIDEPNTAANNNSLFNSNFISKKAFVVNDVLFGRNVFDNIILVATDIGMFWAIKSSGMEANWFYIFEINQPVYSLALFGDKILAGTTDGIYSTTDLKTWSLENNPAVLFPILSMSYRWTNDAGIYVSAHEATFSNDNSDPNNPFGLIVASSDLYENITAYRGIKIFYNGTSFGNYITSETSNNYIKTSVFPESMLGTFNNIEITMAAWWEQFDSETNMFNSNLTNTLLVGGKNMISYNSNPSTYRWSNSNLPSETLGVSIKGFCSLSNGLILAYGSGENNFLLQSSDIGKNWSVVSKFSPITAIVNSSSATVFGHSSLNVSIYPPLNILDGNLDQLKIGLFNGTNLEKESSILWNEINDDGTHTIYIAGIEFYNIIQNGGTFICAIYPQIISSCIEIPNKTNVIYGTNRGVFTDRGSLTSHYNIEGQVLSSGTNGVISDIDFTGYITAVNSTLDETKVNLSVFCSRNIAGGSLTSQKLYITDTNPVEYYYIISNDSQSVNGTINISINASYSSKWISYIGKKITIVGNNSKIYANFDHIFSDGKFDNGTLYVLSNDQTNTQTLSYSISKSTNTYIELMSAIDPESTYSYISSVGPKIGNNIRLIDSSGNLELFVDFTSAVEKNDLVDLTLRKNDTEDNIQYKIIKNTSSTIFVSNQEDNTTELITAFEAGDQFNTSGFVLKSLASFNAKKTTTDIDHYHNISVIGNNVSGVIDSFVSNNESFVTIVVSETEFFDNILLASNMFLLKDATISFWNTENENWQFNSKIVSLDQSNNTITVQLINSNYWDFSAYSLFKISTGWKWEIESSRYGETSGTYYNNFSAIYQKVTADITRESVYIDIEDSTGILANDYVQIVDENEKIMYGFIKQIISTTRIELTEGIKTTFYFVNNPHLKVLRDNFTNNHTHTICRNQIETILVNDYLERGYDSQHYHRVLPYVAQVNSIIIKDQNIILSGEGSIIYSSQDNGNSWKQLTDLNDAKEGGEEIGSVSKLDVYGENIIAGTEKGYLFFNANGETTIPLSNPSV